MNTNLFKAVLGKMLAAYGCIMSIPALVALYYQEATVLTFLGTAALTALVGCILLYRNRRSTGRMGVREGYAIVSAGWLLAALFGALPYLAAHVMPTYIDAVFETVSGLTTTGGSVLSNLEALPRSILFWRSMTHWLGGMGIIVLFIVLLPNMGMGAVHLFNAEVPGPTPDKIVPRIREGAMYLWLIYTGFTLVQIVLLTLAGMSVFDAVNHAFATMATGGFSTRSASISAYNSVWIEAIIIAFMVMAGVNFNLYIFARRKGLSAIFKDIEFKAYIFILLLSSAIVAFSLFSQDQYALGTAIRHSVFQVASIMTTTGFASADFDQWPALAKIVLFLLMFIGGSAGSTAGGIKVARIVLLFKMAWAQFKQIFNPHLVVNITLQGKTVEPAVLTAVGRFFFLFILIFALASVLLAATGLEPFEAMSAVACMIGNVGPGFGAVGPMMNFALVSQFGKVVLIVCMLLGRLELFTILVLVQPEFWKKRKSW